MNQQKYSNVSVEVDGALIAENTSITVTRKSGAIPVHTTAKGLAGFAQGAAETMISGENMVPTADFELDPGKYMKFGKMSTITLRCGGKKLDCKGQFLEDTTSGAVNTAATNRFEFHGGKSEWV